MRKYLKYIRKSYMYLFGNLKIQTKLLLSFVSVFILSILIMIGIFYNNWASSMRVEAVNFSMLYIKQLNENLNTYINELDRLTAMTLADSNVQNILGKKIGNLSDVELKKDVEYMDNFLFNMYTLKPDIKKIIVVGENGSLYVEGARAYSIFDIDPQKYSWYRESKNGLNKIYIYTDLPDESLIGREDQEKKISIVRRIENTENNRTVGCIRIDIPFRKFEEIIKKISQNSSMEIMIVDPQHSTIFDSNQNMKMIDQSNLQKIYTKFEDSSEGNVQIKSSSGSQTIVFSKSTYTKWNIIGFISNTSLLAITKKIMNISIIIAAFTIIIIFGICLIISFGITNPLKKLARSMKSVQEGNFDVKVKALYDDELGQIGRSFNIMVAKIDQLVKKEYFLQLKNKEAELKSLQAQINPHFLYNTLELLRMKALINKDPEVAEMAKKISLFYRTNIMKKSEIVLLTEELENIRYYIDIQNMRFSNRFTYIEDFDEDIKNAKMLKLTLQPLIENAIFHGLEPKSGEGIIILRGWKEEENIIIEIIDDGIGISETQLYNLKTSLESPNLSDEFGIGIVNVHNRIKLHFGEKYGLKVYSEESKGTKLVIQMPYITSQEVDKYAKTIDC